MNGDGASRRPLTRRTLLGVAGLLPLGLAACSSSTGATSDEGFISGTGTFTHIPPDKRTKAPELTGTTLDGKPFSSSKYAGKVLVVNVWGSWCPPCRHEAPELVKAAAQTKGVAQFVGINSRDNDQAQAAAFARVSGMTYPHIYDPSGRMLLDFASLPPKSIPTTLVLDEQGRVAARILGETRASTLVGAVQDVAAGK